MRSKAGVGHLPCTLQTSHQDLALVPHRSRYNSIHALLLPARCNVARSNLRVCQLSRQEAEQFYAVHRGKPFFEKLTAFMSSGRIAAIELVGPGAVPKWRELIGPTDSNKARMEAPSSIRAHYGTDG